MAVRILTDSTSYINKEILKQLDIKKVSLNVVFGEESYKETELNNIEFYRMMEERGIPTSSQPAIGEMQEAMREVISKGDDLLCIFISSDMSGTYSTANMVKEMLLEEYPNANIEIVDSRSNCMQLGYGAIVAARAAKEGKSLEEVKKVAEENIKRSRFIFLPDNLVYLKKGGRIGGASALIGGLLKIIPILTVEDGKTTVLAKVRTKKNAINTMIDRVYKDVEEHGLKEIVVHHINCYDEAVELVNRIKEKLNIEVGICDIGPVIGVHVGPGAIGIAYYTESPLR